MPFTTISLPNLTKFDNMAAHNSLKNEIPDAYYNNYLNQA